MQSTEIKISFILPCYNTEPYLRQCIESLYCQSLTENEYEVICVNNATEDNSEAIIQDIAMSHTNLRYIKLSKNIGAGGAYNAGLQIAQGKYIQFVDSDDYIKSDSIKPLLEKMEAYQLDMLYFNLDSFSGQEWTHEDDLGFNGNFNQPIDCFSGENFIEAFLQQKQYVQMPVPAYRKLIRHQFLIDNNLRFTPTTLGCDWLHNLQCLTKAKRVMAITDRLYCFRNNPTGVTKSAITMQKTAYALNNYSEALLVLHSSGFSSDLQEIISEILLSLINSHLSWYDTGSNHDRIALYGLLHHKRLLRQIATDSCHQKWLTAPRYYICKRKCKKLLRTMLKPIVK